MIDAATLARLREVHAVRNNSGRDWTAYTNTLQCALSALLDSYEAALQEIDRLEWSLIAREALSNERVARIRKKAEHEIERLKQFAPEQGQTHAG